MYSLASDGVDRVKEVIGENDDEKIKIQYAGAPRYRLQVIDTDYKSAEENLKNSIEGMEARAKKLGVVFEFNRSTGK